MSCLSNWEFDYGGERGRGGDRGCCDPVDLLPSDPFGMDFSETFTAALASWVGDHAVSSGDFDAGDEFLVSGFDCREYGLSFGGVVGGECSGSGRVGEGCGNGSEGGEEGPHEGLVYSLGYLGVRDLLSVEMVCRSLKNAVQSDALLWRCIHIDSPLSQRIGDGDLLRLTQRAQGSLHCLSLVGCSRITDDGLKRVLESNPRLKKLSIPGCVRLTVEGLINNLKAVKSWANPGITHLRLGRLFSVTPDNYDELKSLLGADEQEQLHARKPRFYHCGIYSLAFDDESVLDIELCPECQKLKLVYDCPAETCRDKGPEQCRACDVCIARCIECGRCIKNCEYEETFCLENLCSGCWKDPPQNLVTTNEGS
ncbi:F-box protein SKIP14-like [Dioscorea cayenensis subsp. rotundata]|uniref:F-box protein SKIP14-like n=1 Tax=Dioscorea cayennensis subsp. rotundata TaxID=55577 RepID=A0AB40BI91_DIOCR|nr:F-box protein SKIP14-like [Dioscorea cayenensis subsp. rotundata]